ncbi:hypothetical protein L1F30_01310 [Simiduia sp. 21SJ11W-1]|uniref:TlpA family protein disulfide reductase n=1 Tax=Simiduia sp. 21SJ11W-1 TaxID=2909669 RepID=UPI0020A1DA67|nr:hypothetical protein [Simiduia sp. 21SJ11W-1]UTA48192.1 hypothetical protein L1F30_01310 [Simiduia sp. 21SJ11W-1]
MKMTWWLQALALTTLITPALACAQQTLHGQAPDWLLSNAQGEYVSFYEDSDNQASLLMFWTPTCKKRCLAAMEQLNQQAQAAGIKTYLLLNSAHTQQSELPALPTAMAPLFKAHAVGKHYGVRGQPTWVLVDGEKNILQNARVGSQAEPLDALLKAGN